MAGMTKLLWKAIKKARELPARDQDAVASVVLSMIDEKPVVDLDDDTLAAIEEGLAQAELGGFVTDNSVADIDGPPGEEPSAYAGSPAAGGGDGSAADKGRVFNLSRLADQHEWIEPKPEAMSSAAGLVFSPANGTASAVTLEQQPSKPAVADE